jgi:predicted dehydrogenase
MSDVEWHLRNWYNYSWLNGGGFVSQAVHSVDKALWAMGDVPPLSCRAVGGLAAPVEGGDTFDHYHCSYLFPNGIWCHLGARKMSGCLNENADYIQGTHGRLTIGRGTAPFITDLQGKMLWRYRPPREGEPNKYQTQHDELFQSIRAGQPVNDGEDMIRSTLMAILGRMAAHTGQEITWEQALNAGEHLLPQMADLKWTDTLPAFERPIPGSTRIPGI